MTHFTPLSALIGGGLIGASASLLWATTGRVAGISGIVGGLLERGSRDALRVLFVAGLFSGGLLLDVVRPSSFGPVPVGPWPTILAGLFVGFGTRLGGGCTSGHGVCGLSRLSARSLAATLTFTATGALSAVFVQHALRGIR